jgi:hypothetical protein
MGSLAKVLYILFAQRYKKKKPFALVKERILSVYFIYGVSH